MNTATAAQEATMNPFALIAALPADFREVNGGRPSIRNHAQAAAWLARMESATLVAASNLLGIAERTGDKDALVGARQYMAAHQAIAALKAA